MTATEQLLSEQREQLQRHQACKLPNKAQIARLQSAIKDLEKEEKSKDVGKPSTR